MENEKKLKPIRLSNRTAIGLRKAAQRVRNTWLITMGVLTMLAVVLAVYLGMLWLPAVPLTLLVTACVLTAMMITCRSQYLMLISQAICTEAAARQMDERRDENARRKRAIEQLAAMRADVREAEKKGLPMESGRTEESLLFDLLTGREMGENEMRAVDKDKEDEELYSASYKGGHIQNHDEDDEDLHPIKKSKVPTIPAAHVPNLSAAPVPTDETKHIRKLDPALIQAELEKAVTQTQTEVAPRRRRRSAPAENAPLTLLKSEQMR